MEISDCSEPKNQECKYQLKSSNIEHTFVASSPSALQEVVTLESTTDQGLVATGINTNNYFPPKNSCAGGNAVQVTGIARSSERPAVFLQKTSPDFKAEQEMPTKQQRRYTCTYSALDDTFMKKQNTSISSVLSEKELPVYGLQLNPLKSTSGQNFANAITSFHKKPHLTSSNTSDFSSHKINLHRSSVCFMAKSCVSPSTVDSLKLHHSKHFVCKQGLPVCNINIADKDGANSVQEGLTLKVTSTEKPYIFRASGLSKNKAPFCSQTKSSLNGASHKISTVTYPVLRESCAKTSEVTESLMLKSSLPLSKPHNHFKDARVHGNFLSPTLNSSSGLELANTVGHKEFNVNTSQVQMQKSNLGNRLDSIPVCEKETPETSPMIPCLGCRSVAGISHSVKRGLCFKLNEASKSFQATPLSTIPSVQQGKQASCNGQQSSGINTSLLTPISSVNIATGIFAQDGKTYISDGENILLKLPLVPAQQIHAKELALPYVIDTAQSSSIKDTSVNLESIPTSDSKRERIPSLKDTVLKLQKKLDDLISKSTSKRDTDHSSLVYCSKRLCVSLSTKSNPEEKETQWDKSDDKISTPVLLPQGKDKKFIWLTGLDVVVDSLLQMNS